MGWALLFGALHLLVFWFVTSGPRVAFCTDCTNGHPLNTSDVWRYFQDTSPTRSGEFATVGAPTRRRAPPFRGPRIPRSGSLATTTILPTRPRPNGTTLPAELPGSWKPARQTPPPAPDEAHAASTALGPGCPTTRRRASETSPRPWQRSRQSRTHSPPSKPSAVAATKPIPAGNAGTITIPARSAVNAAHRFAA